MLCAQSGATLQQPSWIYELKLDGVRVLAHRDGRIFRVELRFDPPYRM